MEGRDQPSAGAPGTGQLGLRHSRGQLGCLAVPPFRPSGKATAGTHSLRGPESFIRCARCTEASAGKWAFGPESVPFWKPCRAGKGTGSRGLTADALMR